jgi:Zn-finger nucleic acid-binding protein
MFVGCEYCGHCGAKMLKAETSALENAGDCPRCKTKLAGLQIGDIGLQECARCGGLWSAPDMFESICADGENQSAVLNFAGGRSEITGQPAQISYVPCPECKQLMNRSNFARTSGVIIDLCKQHGVWFDAEELPKIVAFIRQGGLEKARQREKLEIKEERDRLRDEVRKAAIDDRRFGTMRPSEEEPSVNSFISFLFD